MPRPILWPTQCSIQWVPGVKRPGHKTTDLHLESRLRMISPVFSAPPPFKLFRSVHRHDVTAQVLWTVIRNLHIVSQFKREAKLTSSLQYCGRRTWLSENTRLLNFMETPTSCSRNVPCGGFSDGWTVRQDMAELTALLENLRMRLKTVYLLRARVSEETHNPASRTGKKMTT